MSYPSIARAVAGPLLVVGLLGPSLAGRSPVDSTDFVATRSVVVAGPEQHNIRSGRHVDSVASPNGSLTIASFRRDSGAAPMRIFVSRIDSAGKTLWTYGDRAQGRATSLATTSTGEVWATGYVETRLPGEPSEEATEPGLRSFIVQLSNEGTVRALRFGPGEAIPMLVRAGADGGLLVVGTARGPFQWDGVSVDGGVEGSTFFGRFDRTGRCRSVQCIVGTVNVNQAAADPTGGFVIGGNFSGAVRFGSQSFETENQYDCDGFLARIDDSGEISWARRYGTPGHPQRHERSREAIYDVFIQPNGDVVGLALQDDRTSAPDSLVLVRCTREGGPRARHSLSIDVRPPGSIALAAAPKGGVYLTYGHRQQKSADGVDPLRLLVLEERDLEFNLVRSYSTPSPTNTMFRSIVATPDALWLAGHFKSTASWGDARLTNDALHQLFWVRQPLR